MWFFILFFHVLPCLSQQKTFEREQNKTTKRTRTPAHIVRIQNQRQVTPRIREGENKRKTRFCGFLYYFSAFYLVYLSQQKTFERASKTNPPPNTHTEHAHKHAHIIPTQKTRGENNPPSHGVNHVPRQNKPLPSESQTVKHGCKEKRGVCRCREATYRLPSSTRSRRSGTGWIRGGAPAKKKPPNNPENKKNTLKTNTKQKGQKGTKKKEEGEEERERRERGYVVKSHRCGCC